MTYHLDPNDPTVAAALAQIGGAAGSLAGQKSGADAGTVAGKAAGKLSGADAGKLAGAAAGQAAGTAAGSISGAAAALATAIAAGTRAGTTSGRIAGDAAGTLSGAAAGQTSGAAAGAVSGADAGTQAGATSGADAGRTAAATYIQNFAAAFGQPNTPHYLYATLAQAKQSYPPAVVVRCSVAGYAAQGDHGAANLVRVAAPSVPRLWHAQFADGSWWQLDHADSFVKPQMMGYAGGDCTVIMQACLDYHPAVGAQSRVALHDGLYSLTGGVIAGGGNPIVIGTGSNRVIIEMGNNDNGIYSAPMLSIGLGTPLATALGKNTAGCASCVVGGFTVQVPSANRFIGGKSDANGAYDKATTTGLANKIPTAYAGSCVYFFGAVEGAQIYDIITRRNNYGIVFEACSYVTIANVQTFGVWDPYRLGLQETLAGVYLVRNLGQGFNTDLRFTECNLVGDGGLGSPARALTYGSYNTDSTGTQAQGAVLTNYNPSDPTYVAPVGSVVNMGPLDGMLVEESEGLRISGGYIGGGSGTNIRFRPKGTISGTVINDVFLDGSSQDTIRVEAVPGGSYLDMLTIISRRVQGYSIARNLLRVDEPPGNLPCLLANLCVLGVKSEGFTAAVLQLNGVQGAVILGCQFRSYNCLGGYADDVNRAGVAVLGSSKDVNVGLCSFGGTSNSPNYNDPNEKWGVYCDVPGDPNKCREYGNSGVYAASTSFAISNLTWLAYTFAPVPGSGAFGINNPATGTGRAYRRDKLGAVSLRVTIPQNSTGATTIYGYLPPNMAAGPGDYILTGKSLVSGKFVLGYIIPGTTQVAISFGDGSYAGSDGEILALSGTYELAA